MKTTITAAILTLSTVLSLGSALLLTFQATGLYTANLSIYILVPYVIAAVFSPLLTKTFLEILTPQLKIEKKMEEEKQSLPNKTPESVEPKSEETPKQAPQTEDAKNDKLAEKEEQPNEEVSSTQLIQKTVLTVEANLKKEAVEAKQETTYQAKPGEEEAPAPTGYEVKLFTPILDELKSLQNELNGLKARLNKPKIESSVKQSEASTS